MENNELRHWGIKGQKWGVRRYQNKDGSLTPAGRERYDDDDDYESYYKERKKEERKERNKKILAIGAAAAATALTVWGIKKYVDSKNSDIASKGKSSVEEALDFLKKSKNNRIYTDDITAFNSENGRTIIDNKNRTITMDQDRFSDIIIERNSLASELAARKNSVTSINSKSSTTSRPSTNKQSIRLADEAVMRRTKKTAAKQQRQINARERSVSNSIERSRNKFLKKRELENSEFLKNYRKNLKKDRERPLKGFL